MLFIDAIDNQSIIYPSAFLPSRMQLDCPSIAGHVTDTHAHTTLTTFRKNEHQVYLLERPNRQCTAGHAAALLIRA